MTLTFCLMFLILRICILSTWNGKDPSLLLPGENLPTNEGNLEGKQSQKTMLTNTFFVCFLLKPFLVELLTFTIKRMLTNILFQFCYTKKGT